MSVNLTLKLDATDVLKKYAGLTKEIEKAAEIALTKGAFIVEAKAKRNAPVDTGRLRSSITTYNDQYAISKSVIAATSYAIYVEEGTKYFTGRHFMDNARQDSESEVRDIFNEEIAKAIA